MAVCIVLKAGRGSSQYLFAFKVWENPMKHLNQYMIFTIGCFCTPLVTGILMILQFLFLYSIW
jgi:hypothetical protein